MPDDRIRLLKDPELYEKLGTKRHRRARPQKFKHPSRGALDDGEKDEGPGPTRTGRSRSSVSAQRRSA